ncbi:MAG: Gfo/Idh/MocA family oxidoreductase [Phycisphaerales bacterium]|nr:Gfo/Idh/MocA family oxidoreductase [Phycisphaerales bacterium]
MLDRLNGMNAEERRSRREFLAWTAGAAGAATVIGNAAVAAAPRFEVLPGRPVKPPKEGEVIRMAVIGTGGMGTGHCAAFANLNTARQAKVQIVALADPWPRNLDRAHKRLTEEWQKGVEITKYADYKELLKRDDIHGVLIASPEHWHAQHAIDAVLAGKDVYCEKPMCLNLTDAMKLAEVAKSHPDVIVQVGTQKMALPAYHEARKWIREGLIGTPTCSQTSYCRNSPKGEWNYYEVDPKWQAGKDVDWEKWCGPIGSMPFDPYVLNRWRRYRRTSTGIIGDLLVHVMTPLMMAMDQGWPVRVTASGAHIIDKTMENHDTLNILAEFETGHQMIVMGATTNDTGLTPMIRGPKGNIEVTDGSLRFTPQKPYAEDAEERKPQLPSIGDDQDQHRMNWLECIRTRKKPEADVESGLKVMVIVDLATRSLWEGGAWTFDPKTMAVKKQ